SSHQRRPTLTPLHFAPARPAARPPPSLHPSLPFSSLFRLSFPVAPILSLSLLLAPSSLSSERQRHPAAPTITGELRTAAARAKANNWRDLSLSLVSAPPFCSEQTSSSNETNQQRAAPTKREAPARLEILEFCTKRVSTDPSSFFSNSMELEDSVLNFSDEDESFEDDEDVKMNDIEEGELVEKISKTGLEETGGACANSETPLPGKKNRRRRKNKGKNKRKRVSSGPITDINRFVLDVGRRLKERKSYLIWNAVGCLGLSALSDLVKEMPLGEAIFSPFSLMDLSSKIASGGTTLWCLFGLISMFLPVLVVLPHGGCNSDLWRPEDC
ncbi:hypothetical protein AABB24_008577, partial [Solanum stoloniferum]